MAEIFLSYRRSDAAGAAGRLTDRLKQKLGDQSVFRDLDSISAGADFEHAIRDAMRGASVVLVVIGPRWVDARADDGRRRLDDPKDYVRLEIETALAQDVPIVPLLVEGAEMPKQGELPPSLAPLALRNAHELSERRWSYDADQLVRQLADRLALTVSETATTERLRGAAAAVAGYVPDLARLVRRPKRTIVSRNGGRDVDVIDALTFWFVSVVLAHVSILLGWPRKSPAWELVAIGLGVGLFTILALSFPLWLAWRLLGARRHYARVLVPLTYQYSVLFLGVALGATLLFFAFDIHEVGKLAQVRDILLATVGTEERFRVMHEAIVPLVETPEFARTLPVFTALQLAVLLWLFLSWGAYRQSLGASRLRSLAAFVLFVVIGWLIVAVLAAALQTFETRVLQRQSAARSSQLTFATET